MAIDLSRYHQLVREASTLRVRGRVTELTGLVVKAAVPGVRVGEVVEIRSKNGRGAVKSEVVGFQGDEVMLMPMGDLTGMTLPLKRTAAERLAAGDPRPSLTELYGTHDGYVQAIARAARQLKADGFMLQEDVDRTIAEAEASDVLK